MNSISQKRSAGVNPVYGFLLLVTFILSFGSPALAHSIRAEIDVSIFILADATDTRGGNVPNTRSIKNPGALRDAQGVDSDGRIQKIDDELEEESRINKLCRPNEKRSDLRGNDSIISALVTGRERTTSAYVMTAAPETASAGGPVPSATHADVTADFYERFYYRLRESNSSTPEQSSATHIPVRFTATTKIRNADSRKHFSSKIIYHKKIRSISPSSTGARSRFITSKKTKKILSGTSL
jgi:hypothetical protein